MNREAPEWKSSPAWKVVESFWVLQTPNGSGCLTPWANPGYYHGVITYADGRIAYVPPTDHFASQKHMEGLPALKGRARWAGEEAFGSSLEAAQAFVEWKLDPPKKRRRTVWERLPR